MRRLDRLAQERFGIPELILMEHAGTAAAREAKRLLRSRGSVLVLSGGGANGGDGFVAARHLANAGFKVRVAVLSSPRKIRGAARTNLEMVRRLGLPCEFFPDEKTWDRRPGKGRGFDLIIDALLGTGLKENVREPFDSAIRWMNQSGIAILSVDLPSGMSADTGRPLPVAARAKVTVTCGLPKAGLLAPKALACRGRLVVADIGLPRALTRRKGPWSSS
jgi:NAD(P)H-hydrate epimerase